MNVVQNVIFGVFDVVIAGFRLIKNVIHMLPNEVCILIVVAIVIWILSFIPLVGD